ncbi:uncharacterized protein LOC128673899 isoform X2 [Plodia interpunctella]|uniref:uncharacterized protein LOC128673899 isoform X2 n=1 Tax=Plodia interpunctella TaxID=58824 RepID=UPI0023677FF5|nr:uncharacterized protein LOC128673899 isoform X2 [Plodia interpunctella]
MLIMTEIYGDDDINKVSPFFSNRVHIAAYGMRWRRRQCRVNISYFILLLIFVLSGVLVLTQLLFERSKFPRHRYEELQAWYGRTEFAGADGGEILGSVQYPQDGVWQRVAGTRFKFYVYSAFVERRTVAAVRIIAATKTRGPDPVVCRLWLPDNRTVTLKARVKAIRENWNYRYSATYILCLLSDSGIKPQETAGASVAVLASAWADKPHSNLLTIVDTTPINENKLESLQVCVKPLHSSFARADWLVEWFEFNRLLGASHFYMYNKSTSAPVGCVLNYYRRLGLVTLLPWKLPMQSLVEIRTEGQFAAFNDCLYRSMPHTNWLLVIDVDELVLPRRERTLPALLEDSRAKQHMAMKNPPSGFLFRNAFFYLFWKDLWIRIGRPVAPRWVCVAGRRELARGAGDGAQDAAARDAAGREAPQQVRRAPARRARARQPLRVGARARRALRRRRARARAAAPLPGCVRSGRPVVLRHAVHRGPHGPPLDRRAHSQGQTCPRRHQTESLLKVTDKCSPQKC